MSIPGLDLYQHKKSGNFTLLNLVENKEFGFDDAYGPLIPIAEDTMHANGLEIVLEHLREYDKREKHAKAEIDQLSKQDQTKLEKNNRTVGVTLRNDGKELWLSPTRKNARGGGVGYEEDRIVVQMPCDNESFYQQLMETFVRCT